MSIKSLCNPLQQVMLVSEKKFDASVKKEVCQEKGEVFRPNCRKFWIIFQLDFIF